MTGIVERLRGRSSNLVVGHGNRTILSEAAALIEALEAENARLLDQREAAMIWGDANSARVEPLQADRDRLAAQVKALREGLKRFMSIATAEGWSTGRDPKKDAAAFHGARTLLSTTEPKT